jgi:hypothetical protein
VTVSTRALAREDGTYLCYISADQVKNLKSGMSAQVDGEFATVEWVAQTPLSRAEASRALPGDYVAYALGVSDWNVAVELRLSAESGDAAALVPAGTVRDAVITTDTIRPLSFLWN